MTDTARFSPSTHVSMGPCWPSPALAGFARERFAAMKGKKVAGRREI
jgi:hypothetical protein